MVLIYILEELHRLSLGSSVGFLLVFKEILRVLWVPRWVFSMLFLVRLRSSVVLFHALKELHLSSADI